MATAVQVQPQDPPKMENYREKSPEESSTITTIPVPYASRLLESIEAGQMLLIRGFIKPEAKRFEINLLNGVSSPRQLEYHAIPKQVPLHTCFHFEVGVSVMNSYLDGDWGYEECHINPFFSGKPFEVAIRVHEDKYEILTDNKHLVFYPHRVSYKTVDYIQVKGDVQLSTIRWVDADASKSEAMQTDTAVAGAELPAI